jgi:hypothetical protein
MNTGEVIAGAVALAVVGGVAYYVTRPTPTPSGEKPKTGNAPGSSGSGLPGFDGNNVIGGVNGVADFTPEVGDDLTRDAAKDAETSIEIVRRYMRNFNPAGAGKIVVCVPQQNESAYHNVYTPFIPADGVTCVRPKAVRGFFLNGKLWTFDRDASRAFTREALYQQSTSLGLPGGKPYAWAVAFRVGRDGAPLSRSATGQRYPAVDEVWSFLTDDVSDQAAAWSPGDKRWLSPNEWEYFAPKATESGFVVDRTMIASLRNRLKVRPW